MLGTTHGYSQMALGITTLSSCQTSTSPTARRGWLVLVVVVVAGLILLTISGVVCRDLRHHWRGGVRGGEVADLGIVGGEDRIQQVPHFAQFDHHPNQDYPSFASYLAPFSYHQALVASLHPQERA